MRKFIQIAFYAIKQVKRRTSVSCVLFLVGCSVWAQTSGAWGDNLTWNFSDGTLTISGTGEMKETTSSGYPWYAFKSDINKLVINEGVSSIAAEAFSQWRPWGGYNIKELNLANGLTYIGEAAFSGIKLAELALPNEVEYIGNRAFHSCEFNKLYISDKAKHIGENAFGYGSELTYLSLPASILNDSIITGNLFYNNITESMDTLIIRGHADSIDLTLVLSAGAQVKYMECPKSVSYIKHHVIEGIGEQIVSLDKYDNSIPELLRRRHIYDFNNDGIMESIIDDRQTGYIYNPWGLLLTTIAKNNSGDSYFMNYNNDSIALFAYDSFGNGEGEYYIQSNTQMHKFPYNERLGDNLLCTEDINGDGRTDIVTEQYVYIKQPDDFYVRTEIEYVDTDEVDSLKYQQITSNQSKFNGLSYNNVVHAYSPSSDPYCAIVMDIDQNGYADIVDITTGNVVFNYGNNKFMRGNMGSEIMAIKDLNGDNIPDFVLYDSQAQETSLIFYDQNGKFTNKSLVKDLVLSKVWTYDFDRDGDADILLAFNYVESISSSFLVIYRNDGNNTYTQIEQSFREKFYFADCKDVDNDGLFEVLAYKDYNSDAYFNLIKCEQALTFSLDATPIFVHKEKEGINAVIGDFDADGLIELNSSEVMVEFGGIPNTAPAQMDRPNILYDGSSDKLEISWGNGQDVENTSIDLTYALRIGTEPGKGDVLFAHAATDGRRLNLRQGNMGYAHNYWFDASSLPQGKYYIAVQAIDANFMGGAWSDETIYERKTLGVGFCISQNSMTTADTLIISLNGKKLSELAYEWNFGDSAIVVQEDENCIYVCYNTTGNRTITLTVKDGIGNISETYYKDVTVLSSRLVEQSNIYPDLFLDFNMDGEIDYIDGQFYQNQNDGSGQFSGVDKIFNLNLSIKDPLMTDYNMDGLADVIGSSNKGNVFINKGNSNFEIQSIESTFFDTPSYRRSGYCDFNNDGFADIIDDDEASIITYTEGLQPLDTLELEIKNGDLIGIYDFNKDGYIDLYAMLSYRIDDDWYHNIAIYLNKGNGQFEEKELNHISIRIVTCNPVFKSSSQIVMVSDMDSDGYMDIITSPTDLTLKIYYGDADYSYTRTETVYVSEDMTCASINIADIDNNGYPDIVGSNKDDLGQRCGYIVYNYGFNNKILDDAQGGIVTYYTDINNDKIPDLVGSGIQMLNRTRITNTPPSVPTGLRVNQGAAGVVLAWDDSYDKETPTTQMRYIISVKKKGATGDGAYIISPLNGGVDSAAISPAYNYLRSTCMTMPLERFEKGVEYEFCVQAIDAWNETSAMSVPVSFVFEGGEGITVSSYEVCVGEAITATFVSSDNNTPVWSSEEGHITEESDEVISVIWSEGGQKELTATAGGKTYTATINVKENATDLSFSLPSMVLGGAPVHFTLPEAFADPTMSIEIESDAYIQRRGSTLDAIAVFPEKDGEYPITLRTAEREQCGVVEYTQYVQVVGNNITPVISIVGIDEATGKNRIEWSVPDNVFERTDLFDQIWVYKESGKTDEYIKLAELPLTATSYIDMSSDPTVRKSRYRITLHTTYGGESKPSATHSNVHVMLNKGLHNSVNIIWTKYEGATIEQYTILKGTSPDNLSVLTTASGNETSYTDQNVQDDENVYYALSYSNTYETEWIALELSDVQKNTRMETRATNVATGQSNVVASGEGINTVFSTELNIMCLESSAELTPYQQSLHLYPELLPTNASIKQVAWNITVGGELAIIDDNGTLTYIGNGESGSVTVEAKTIDGSNLTNSITIPIDWTYAPTLVKEITIIPDYIEITPENNNVQLVVDVQPLDATDKTFTWSVENGYEGYLNISEDNVLTGRRNTNGYVTVTATANDGSGVYATAEVQISGLWDYPLTESIRIYSNWEDSAVVSVEWPSVQLYVDYTPYDALPEISWSVVEGADVVSVDQSGLVTFLYEPGKAVVRASANDGSGVYDDYVVIGDITFIETVNVISNGEDVAVVNVTPQSPFVNVWVELTPNDVDTYNVKWEFVSGDNEIVATNDDMGASNGLYLYALGNDGSTVLRATALDKKAVYDEVNIVASGFEPTFELLMDDNVLSPNTMSINLYGGLAYWITTGEGHFIQEYIDVDWEIVSGGDIAELIYTNNEYGAWYALNSKERNGDVLLRASAIYNGIYYSKDTLVTANGFYVELEDMEIVSDIEQLTPENLCLEATIRYVPENANDREVGWRIEEIASNVNVQITESTDSTCMVCANQETGNGTFTLVAYRLYGTDLVVSKIFELAGFETAISTTEADTPKLYPTIANSTIYFEGLCDNCQIAISSLNGVPVKYIVIDKVKNVQPVDVSDVAPGIYFASVKMLDGSRVVYKFVKR